MPQSKPPPPHDYFNRESVKLSNLAMQHIDSEIRKANLLPLIGEIRQVVGLYLARAARQAMSHTAELSRAQIDTSAAILTFPAVTKSEPPEPQPPSPV